MMTVIIVTLNVVFFILHMADTFAEVTCPLACTWDNQGNFSLSTTDSTLHLIFLVLNLFHPQEQHLHAFKP